MSDKSSSKGGGAGVQGTGRAVAEFLYVLKDLGGGGGGMVGSGFIFQEWSYVII